MWYTLETLDVYIAAEKFSNRIWGLIGNWKQFEKETVGKQFARAADSISANSAEGYGRYHFSDSILFFYYARGSILETKSWLRKSADRNLIEKKEFDTLLSDLEAVHLKLNAYIRYVSKIKLKVTRKPG